MDQDFSALGSTVERCTLSPTTTEHILAHRKVSFSAVVDPEMHQWHKIDEEEDKESIAKYPKEPHPLRLGASGEGEELHLMAPCGGDGGETPDSEPSESEDCEIEPECAEMEVESSEEQKQQPPQQQQPQQ